MHAATGQPLLLQILLFFGKAGSFVFGSGLAIVPFLQQGVVHDFGWLSDHQFLDAVAVALITPGPVVITVAFIGYLVAGVAGAVLAAVGIFLPVYVFTVVPAPWFARHRHNRAAASIRHGGDGRGERRDRGSGRRARTSGDRRHRHRVHRGRRTAVARSRPGAGASSGLGAGLAGLAHVTVVKQGRSVR